MFTIWPGLNNPEDLNVLYHCIVNLKYRKSLKVYSVFSSPVLINVFGVFRPSTVKYIGCGENRN